jgi:phage shock protein B
MECRWFPLPAIFAVSEEFFGLLMIAAIVCLVVWALRRASRSGGTRRAATYNEGDAETQALARMIDQLDRMERRMQNLETIIIDQEPSCQCCERRR